MKEEIIKALSVALDNGFKDACVYRNIVKQGFKTPCFCVNEKSVEDRLFRGKRRYFKTEIEIRYYNDSFDNIVEAVFNLIEFLNTENIGMVIASDLKSENCDEYMKMTATYEFYYIAETEEEKGDYMETMDLNMDI